ncbi:MAG: hypothetical protein ACT4QD_16385 [Acidobacteriota bacterium]
MTEALVAALVAAIVSVILSLLLKPSAGSFLDASKAVKGVILLYGGNTADTCQAKVIPDPIRVKKNGKAEWDIVDLSGITATHDIGFDWLGSGNPLEPGEPAPDKKKLKGKLKKEDLGFYAYSVIAILRSDPMNKTVLADPDLEIVM